MASTACNYLKKGASVFFEYDTPKIVHIRSKSIGVVNRIVQLVIIGYIIGWVLVYKKGYQETDMGVSGSTTKVKGVAYPNVSNPRVPDRVWDASDIVIPAEENNAFFVMTNMIVTNNQSPGECPEAPGVKEAHCTQDSDCVPGTPYLLGHGYWYLQQTNRDMYDQSLVSHRKRHTANRGCTIKRNQGFYRACQEPCLFSVIQRNSQ